MAVVRVLLVVLAGCTGDGLPDARLPRSTSILEIPEPDAVVVVETSIVLDGVPLIRVDDVLAGEALSIPALKEGLAARKAAIEGAASTDPAAEAFRGAVSLEVDRDLPSDLVLRLLYTAGQAGFGKPWLVVTDPAGARRGIKLVLPEAASAGVAAADAAGELVEGGYANPRVEVLPDRGFVVHASDATVGDGLLVPCPATPCGDAWPFVELNRLVRRVKLDHPRDRAAVVVPGRTVPIQVLVGTLDATRHDALAGRPGTELLPDAILGRARE